MNICMFTGRLTRDAEIIYTNSGHAIMKFGFAINTGYGEKKVVHFLNCFKFLRENEEKLVPTLVKGKPLTITAEYQVAKWNDQEGKEQSRPEFRIIEWEYVMIDNTGKQEEKQEAPRQQNPRGRRNNYIEAPF